MGIQRKTKSLQAVYEAFGDSNEALSVKMIRDRLGESVNKTTVYRLLDRLEEDGMVHSFSGEDSVTFYARCHACKGVSHNHNHPHFNCVSCDKVLCMEEEVVLPLSGKFKVTEARIFLKGICAECA